MGKATVVNLSPFNIREIKPIQPSVYEIPLAKLKRAKVLKPGLMTISDGHEYIYLGDHSDVQERNYTKRIIEVNEIAGAICRDYRGGVQLGDYAPGVYWLEGEKTAKNFRETDELEDMFQEYQKEQEQWMLGQIHVADSEWLTSGKQPMVISDVQRTVCRLLGLEKSKGWMDVIPDDADFIVCPACMSSVPVGATVCRACHCILDKEKYESMEFAQTA